MLSNLNDCWTIQDHRNILEYSNSYMWRFIQKNSTISSVEDVYLNLTNLSQSDLKLLSNIHFILSEKVQNFVYEIAPLILKNLSKTSLKEYESVRGNVKGRIDWNKTIKERYSKGGDPSIFVTNKRASIFDLPENRVLLFLLERIVHLCSNLTNTVIKHESYKYLDNLSNKWVVNVQEIGAKANSLLNNPFIKKVSGLHILSQKTINSTEKVRGHLYTKTADIGRMYNQLSYNPLEFLNNMLQGNALKPLSKDSLYEIAVFFKVLNTLEHSGWKEERSGLIGGESTIVSQHNLEKRKLKIYYQGLPPDFIEKSKYGPLMNEYGLSARHRRPDIILEITEDDQKTYYIIEVKRSDKRKYLSDGAYKLFGYIKDFEEVTNSKTTIKGILVGWSNIQEKYSFETDSEVYLTPWNNLNNLLKFIFTPKK